jgi:hypothetical protein
MEEKARGRLKVVGEGEVEDSRRRRVNVTPDYGWAAVNQSID